MAYTKSTESLKLAFIGDMEGEANALALANNDMCVTVLADAGLEFTAALKTASARP